MIFLLLVLISSSLVSAVMYRDMNVDISIEEDFVHQKIDIQYSEPVSKSDYFVLANINNVVVYNDNETFDCDVNKYDLGYSIICEDINTTNIVYEFDSYGLVKKQGKINKFYYPFSISSLTDEFNLTIKLPVGSVLPEKSKLEEIGLTQYTPTDAKQSSDGRRIYLEWSFNKPKLGSTIDVSVLFEKNDVSQTGVVLGVIFVVIVMISIFHYSRKNSYDIIMPVLTRDERKVMEMLLNSDKKEVDQKKIIKEIDASKAKVSRIIKNLEMRGLVEIKRMGRKNKIKLVEKPQINKKLITDDKSTK